jgi:hypothetical protein
VSATDNRSALVDAAERAVLGSILNHPTAVLEALEHVEGAQFAYPQHEYIFNAAVAIHKHGLPVDLITVSSQLADDGHLTDNLYSHMVTLAVNSCLPAQIGFHAELIASESDRRRVQDSVRRATQALADTEVDDLHLVAKQLAQEFSELAEPRTADGSTRPEKFPSIDWDTAFAIDFSDVDWLPGKFLEHGQQAAIVGGGKVGKSLFLHDWIYRCVTGRRFLSDECHEPLSVLYFDRENNLRDVITRMVSFGATPSELERLDYRLFPGFAGALDQSSTAAAELLAIVDEAQPDLVVFDTVSRFIAGKENDSDTWLAFYRAVHAPLKQRGIAGVRLDHMGKDEEKGSRGSSAKAQDVDHVWELTQQDLRLTYDTQAGTETIITDLRLHRTHSRTGLGQETFFVTRRGKRETAGNWLPGGTAHELSDPGPLRSHHDAVQRYVDELVGKGAPGGMGREVLRRWAADNGVLLPGKNAVLADIATALKAANAA